MKIAILRLDLLSPLYYFREEESLPFSYRDGSGEKLFCFELDETQRLSFEPDREKLLGNLLFGGEASGEKPDEAKKAGKALLELPRGKYLFAQERGILSRENIIAAAVEIQQEGLWQKLQPGEKLFLRYLLEDGLNVTQLFRPYTESKRRF